MYALVKFKCNGAVKAVHIDTVRVVVKENGEKRFEPFKPAHDKDFFPYRRNKYAVFVDQGEETARRWYVMVGRLGASPEEVLDDCNGPVLWPVPHVQDASETGKGPLTGCVAMDPERKKEADGPELKTESGTSRAPTLLCEETKVFQAISTQTEGDKYVEEKYEELKAMIERLENSKAESCCTTKKNMTDFVNAVFEAVESAFSSGTAKIDNTCSQVLKRVEVVEQFLSRFKLQIMRNANMAQVNEWVNSVSPNIPEAIVETPQDILNDKEVTIPEEASQSDMDLFMSEITEA